MIEQSRLNKLSIQAAAFALLILTATAGGLAASYGNPLYLVIVPVVLVAVVIALNHHLLLLITLFGGLIVSGLFQLYVPQLQLLRWAFSASATFLLVYVAIYQLKQNSFNVRVDSAVIFWSLSFIALLILSSLLQDQSFKISIVGIKGYLQVWGILFALALLPWKQSYAKKFPLFILLVSLIQIPFVLHQYFFLVPMRQLITNVPGLVPIDIVSGTFGGKIDHGGANAALTVLCFITGAGLTALWKNKLIAFHTFLILISLVMFPAFINSTKVSMLYLFIVLFITFFDELIYQPIKFLTKLLAVMLLCGVIGISVISSMPQTANVTSLSELYEYTYGYNFEKSNIRDNNLSRSGTMEAWFKPVKPHDFGDMIVGYGIGASRLIDSPAGQKISTTINLERETGVTAFAAIIWETGILGFITIVMLFFSAFYATTRLKRIYKSPYHRSIFTALQCAVVILFISLGHHNFFILHIGFQTLFVTIFGYIAHWEVVTINNQRELTGKSMLYMPIDDHSYDYEYFD